MLGKKVGYEEPANQMQYDAAYKEMGIKKIHAHYSLEGKVLDWKCRSYQVSWLNNLKWLEM